jgi:hypothetical protein
VLEGIPVGTLTPAALLGIIILFIAMGRLVPRRTMDDVIKDRTEWREAHRVSEQARLELQQQVNELLEHSRATSAFLQSLPLGVARARTVESIEPPDPKG